MTFADNLHRLRNSAGLSQMDLSRLSGISIDSVRNWEQGKALPRIDAVLKLASALGIGVNELLKGIDTEAKPSAAPKRKTQRKQRGK